MNDLTHIDLFSGIGGFALAAGRAGFRTIAMCEIDTFCQEVLKARFGAIAEPDGTGLAKRKGIGPDDEPKCKAIERNPVLIPDIRDFDGARFRGATLLTGGFPCQPFSHAGKRRGKADDRALWPQMLRVIHEARVAWVIGENVSGLISMELDQVLADLEMEGYAARTFHIGAVGVNAPHRRMRVWIVGHSGGVGLPGVDGGRAGKEFTDGHRQPEHAENNAEEHELSTRNAVRPRTDARPPTSRPRDSVGESDRDAPDAEGRKRQPGQKDNAIRGSREAREICGRGDWDIPWIEVATRLCRVDDGLPAWVHARRVARLKVLGNAIVPQVAYQIIKGIAEIERA